jgi:predicted RNA-binding protein with PUA-like domain
MPHWLFKSEPSSWSWDEQVAAGDAGTPWTGVRNHLAKKHMQSMKAGEQGFFYHSNEGKAVVGIVEVLREYHPDDTDPTGRFGLVDLKAVKPLPEPVTLDAIKCQPELADMVLIRNSRLSVQPVSDREWEIVCRLGGL